MAPPAGWSEAAPLPPAWRPAPGKGWSRAQPFLSSSVEGRSIPGQFRASLNKGSQGKVSQSHSFAGFGPPQVALIGARAFKSGQNRSSKKNKNKRWVPPYTIIYSVWAASCRAVWIRGRPFGRPRSGGYPNWPLLGFLFFAAPVLAAFESS